MSNIYVVNISSADRESGTDDQSTFSVRTPITLDGVSGYKIALSQVHFMNARPVVHSYANKIYFVEGAGTLEATLTSGDYTAADLVTELATQMTAVGGTTYTGTYNAVDGSFGLTTSPSTSFNFVSGVNNGYQALGIPHLASALPTASATSFTSTDVVNVSGTNYIDMVTDMPVETASSNNLPVFARIPVPVAYGGYVNYVPSDVDYHYLKQNSISKIRVHLYDDQQNPFVLPTNIHVSITFKLMPLY